jgi:hypothetical protein
MSSVTEFSKFAISGNVLEQWPYWLCLLGSNIIALYVSRYLFGFASERGKLAAMSADFAEIKRQLEETTRTAKTIEYALSHKDWTEREYKTLRRTKLEQIVLYGHEARVWLTDKLWETGEASIERTPSPLPKANITARLYFRELQLTTADLSVKQLDFEKTAKVFQRDLIKIRFLIEKNKRESDHCNLISGNHYDRLEQLASDRDALYESEMKTIDARGNALLAIYMDFSNLLSTLEKQAAELMDQTISVH